MNDTLRTYIKEYSGDKDWNDFVSVYEIERDSTMTDTDEIFLVLEKKTKNLENWLRAKLGGLGGASANEVLEMGEDGITAMREAIMRMPEYL